MDALTKALTYAELAEARGITIAATKTLVWRKRWPRTRGNDGLTRVQVPEEEIGKPSQESPHEPSHEPPQESAQESPHESPSSLAAIAALERHVTRLEALLEAREKALVEAREEARAVAGLKAFLETSESALAKARSEVAEAREKALVEAIMGAGLRASLDALRAERDRLLTREHLREQRRWWRRLAG
jgi:hypothetical protein